MAGGGGGHPYVRAPALGVAAAAAVRGGTAAGGGVGQAANKPLVVGNSHARRLFQEGPSPPWWCRWTSSTSLQGAD